MLLLYLLCFYIYRKIRLVNKETIRAHSAKTKASVKIFFDVCRFFSNLFGLFFYFFAFAIAFARSQLTFKVNSEREKANILFDVYIT